MLESTLAHFTKCDCIADCNNNSVHLLKRLMFKEELVGAVYMLGNIYFVARRYCHVLVCTGYSPYDVTETIPLDGMDPVDIAVSYVDVCVYVLDDGNGKVLRIGQNHLTSTAVDGLKRGNLLCMSVAIDGRLLIMDKDLVISTYEKDGSFSRVICVPSELKHANHAVEVASNIIVVCGGSTVAKISENGHLLDRRECLSTGSCKYVSVDKEGNPIVCDWSENRIIQLDSKSLEVIDDNLLTLERDGIERPQHVQYVLDNGMMLVCWMNCLDVYSFRQNAKQGYLACSKHDTQEQQKREAALLESKVVHTDDTFRNLVKSRIKCVFSDSPPKPCELEPPTVSSLGEFMYAVCLLLK